METMASGEDTDAVQSPTSYFAEEQTGLVSTNADKMALNVDLPSEPDRPPLVKYRHGYQIHY